MSECGQKVEIDFAARALELAREALEDYLALGSRLHLVIANLEAVARASGPGWGDAPIGSHAVAPVAWPD